MRSCLTTHHADWQCELMADCVCELICWMSLVSKNSFVETWTAIQPPDQCLCIVTVVCSCKFTFRLCRNHVMTRVCYDSSRPHVVLSWLLQVICSLLLTGSCVLTCCDELDVVFYWTLSQDWYKPCCCWSRCSSSLVTDTVSDQCLCIVTVVCSCKFTPTQHSTFKSSRPMFMCNM